MFDDVDGIKEFVCFFALSFKNYLVVDMITINGKYTGETLDGQVLHGEGLSVNKDKSKIETSILFQTGCTTDFDGLGESLSF